MSTSAGENRSESRTVSRCMVCGFTEIRTDEVQDDEFLVLAECPHCEHRWTQRMLPVRVPPRTIRPATVGPMTTPRSVANMA